MLFALHRKVTLHGGKPRKRLGVRYARGREYGFDVDLERDEPPFHLQVRRDSRMHLPQVAELPPLEDHGGAPAGMKELGRSALIGARRCGEPLDAPVQDRLEAIESLAG